MKHSNKMKCISLMMLYRLVQSTVNINISRCEQLEKIFLDDDQYRKMNEANTGALGGREDEGESESSVYENTTTAGGRNTSGQKYIVANRNLKHTMYEKLKSLSNNCDQLLDELTSNKANVDLQFESTSNVVNMLKYMKGSFSMIKECGKINELVDEAAREYKSFVTEDQFDECCRSDEEKRMFELALDTVFTDFEKTKNDHYNILSTIGQIKFSIGEIGFDNRPLTIPEDQSMENLTGEAVTFWKQCLSSYNDNIKMMSKLTFSYEEAIRQYYSLCEKWCSVIKQQALNIDNLIKNLEKGNFVLDYKLRSYSLDERDKESLLLKKQGLSATMKHLNACLVSLRSMEMSVISICDVMISETASKHRIISDDRIAADNRKFAKILAQCDINLTAVKLRTSDIETLKLQQDLQNEFAVSMVNLGFNTTEFSENKRIKAAKKNAQCLGDLRYMFYDAQNERDYNALQLAKNLSNEDPDRFFAAYFTLLEFTQGLNYERSEMVKQIIEYHADGTDHKMIRQTIEYLTTTFNYSINQYVISLISTSEIKPLEELKKLVSIFRSLVCSYTKSYPDTLKQYVTREIEMGINAQYKGMLYNINDLSQKAVANTKFIISMCLRITNDNLLLTFKQTEKEFLLDAALLILEMNEIKTEMSDIAMNFDVLTINDFYDGEKLSGNLAKFEQNIINQITLIYENAKSQIDCLYDHENNFTSHELTNALNMIHSAKNSIEAYYNFGKATKSILLCEMTRRYLDDMEKRSVATKEKLITELDNNLRMMNALNEERKLPKNPVLFKEEQMVELIEKILHLLQTVLRFDPQLFSRHYQATFDCYTSAIEFLIPIHLQKHYPAGLSLPQSADLNDISNSHLHEDSAANAQQNLDPSQIQNHVEEASTVQNEDILDFRMYHSKLSRWLSEMSAKFPLIDQLEDDDARFAYSEAAEAIHKKVKDFYFPFQQVNCTDFVDALNNNSVISHLNQTIALTYKDIMENGLSEFKNLNALKPGSLPVSEAANRFRDSVTGIVGSLKSLHKAIDAFKQITHSDSKNSVGKIREELALEASKLKSDIEIHHFMYQHISAFIKKNPDFGLHNDLHLYLEQNLELCRELTNLMTVNDEYVVDVIYNENSISEYYGKDFYKFHVEIALHIYPKSIDVSIESSFERIERVKNHIIDTAPGKKVTEKLVEEYNTLLDVEFEYLESHYQAFTKEKLNELKMQTSYLDMKKINIEILNHLKEIPHNHIKYIPDRPAQDVPTIDMNKYTINQIVNSTLKEIHAHFMYQVEHFNGDNESFTELISIYADVEEFSVMHGYKSYADTILNRHVAGFVKLIQNFNVLTSDLSDYNDKQASDVRNSKIHAVIDDLIHNLDVVTSNSGLHEYFTYVYRYILHRYFVTACHYYREAFTQSQQDQNPSDATIEKNHGAFSERVLYVIDLFTDINQNAVANNIICRSLSKQYLRVVKKSPSYDTAEFTQDIKDLIDCANNNENELIQCVIKHQIAYLFNTPANNALDGKKPKNLEKENAMFRNMAITIFKRLIDSYTKLFEIECNENIQKALKNNNFDLNIAHSASKTLSKRSEFTLQCMDKIVYSETATLVNPIVEAFADYAKIVEYMNLTMLYRKLLIMDVTTKDCKIKDAIEAILVLQEAIEYRFERRDSKQHISFVRVKKQMSLQENQKFIVDEIINKRIADFLINTIPNLTTVEAILKCKSDIEYILDKFTDYSDFRSESRTPSHRNELLNHARNSMVKMFELGCAIKSKLIRISSAHLSAIGKKYENNHVEIIKKTHDAKLIYDMRINCIDYCTEQLAVQIDVINTVMRCGYKSVNDLSYDADRIDYEQLRVYFGVNEDVLVHLNDFIAYRSGTFHVNFKGDNLFDNGTGYMHMNLPNKPIARSIDALFLQFDNFFEKIDSFSLDFDAKITRITSGYNDKKNLSCEDMVDIRDSLSKLFCESRWREVSIATKRFDVGIKQMTDEVQSYSSDHDFESLQQYTEMTTSILKAPIFHISQYVTQVLAAKSAYDENIKTAFESNDNNNDKLTEIIEILQSTANKINEAAIDCVLKPKHTKFCQLQEFSSIIDNSLLEKTDCEIIYNMLEAADFTIEKYYRTFSFIHKSYNSETIGSLKHIEHFYKQISKSFIENFGLKMQLLCDNNQIHLSDTSDPAVIQAIIDKIDVLQEKLTKSTESLTNLLNTRSNKKDADVDLICTGSLTLLKNVEILISKLKEEIVRIKNIGVDVASCEGQGTTVENKKLDEARELENNLEKPQNPSNNNTTENCQQNTPEAAKVSNNTIPVEKSQKTNCSKLSDSKTVGAATLEKTSDEDTIANIQNLLKTEEVAKADEGSDVPCNNTDECCNTNEAADCSDPEKKDKGIKLSDILKIGAIIAIVALAIGFGSYLYYVSKKPE